MNLILSFTAGRQIREGIQKSGGGKKSKKASSKQRVQLNSCGAQRLQDSKQAFETCCRQRWLDRHHVDCRRFTLEYKAP